MVNHRVDFNLKDISPKIGANSTTGITAGSDLVETSMFIFVNIVKATHLLSHAPVLDPYVEVKIGRFRGTTLCFSNNFEPKWDQVFALEKDQLQIHEETIDILVKNNALSYNNEYIGRISFNVSDITTRFPTESELAPEWCGLVDQMGRGFCGQLMVSCWIGTQADKAFPKAFHLQLLSAPPVHVYNLVNTFSKTYVIPRIWCLRVHLIQIQGLVFSEDVSQIFVRVTLGNFISTSKLAKSSNNGMLIWNEDLFFAMVEPFDQQLIFNVEQVTVLGNFRSLGTCGFSVKNEHIRVDGYPVATKTINIIQNERFAGRLSVRISLDGGYHMFDEEPQYRSDLNPTHKLLWLPNVGVFELGILNATGLPAMKPRGRTDAYCVAKYGPKWIRSRTIINNLSPKWNEQYSWDVYDPSTFITVSVFDNCQLLEGNVATGDHDTRIGKVRICLSEMESNRVYIYSYPLVELQPSGLKKMGEIQLAFRFSVPNMFNLCKVYTLPTLPEQHFADPLSPNQYKLLRQQTLRLVASKLRESEPPIRSEVVEYMLDSREIVWSMRRCRADFERINNVFVNGLVSIYTQFDEIRRWKDPISTVIIISLVFLVVIVHPQHLLLAIFSCLFLHVIQQFRKKPRELSHVDLHLSHVHTTSIDELEEEFDLIPSSFGDMIMRNRYDRLRIVAGKYVALMGDIATAFERLQSLLRWQDPIATMLVMSLCLVTGILSLAVPFQVILLVWFLYLVRHPIFRSPFPAFYKNWLRRMPSKLDSMI